MAICNVIEDTIRTVIPSSEISTLIDNMGTCFHWPAIHL